MVIYVDVTTCDNLFMFKRKHQDTHFLLIVEDFLDEGFLAINVFLIGCFSEQIFWERVDIFVQIMAIITKKSTNYLGTVTTRYQAASNKANE